MGVCRARHAQQGECERADCLRASEQSVREAVDSLSPAGGVIVLVIGIWNSGYKSGTFISKTNITIQGPGRPRFAADFGATTGRTFVLGALGASSGAGYLRCEILASTLVKIYP